MWTGISWLRSEVWEPFVLGEENTDKGNVQYNFPRDLEGGDPGQSVGWAGVLRTGPLVAGKNGISFDMFQDENPMCIP